ncbi:MAG: hypothetical protein KAI67_06495 [Candidatus Pacebacteria bacterium]|nr:hypothetical protein [Candidatus Paceibacterota bacterium]
MLFWPILIGAIVCLILAISGDDDKIGSIIQVIKIIALIIGIATIALTHPMHADELHDIPNVTVISNSSGVNILDQIDNKHIREVDIDLAFSLAQNIMGTKDNLGSIYQVDKDELHIQIINGHEFWIAPLEFQNYWRWSAKKTSPGFIMVDAEDAFAEAQMYTGYDMKYMPSAYFSKYLLRHVYSQGYTNVKLEDFTFEVTDELYPYWTITTTKPTINNDGYVLNSLLIVDPITGEINEHLAGELPEWTDRFMPERVAINYVSWYGAYSISWWNAKGFINSIKEDVNVLTSVSQRDSFDKKEMFFVYGSDGEPYWFSGLTSPSSADQSLTGIVLVAVREPNTIIHIKMTGANEQAALDTVNSKYTNFPDRYGTAVIPHGIYGELTYIIPIDSHTSSGNVFQEIGFVNAKTKHAVVRPTQEEAMAEYKSYLAERNIHKALTSGSTDKMLNATVERIGATALSGKSSYRLWLNNSNAIFSVSPALFPVVVVTQPDDIISISYADTEDTVLEVNAFTNHNVTVRIGIDQIELDRETANLTQKKETNWDKQQELDDELAILRGQ